MYMSQRDVLMQVKGATGNNNNKAIEKKHSISLEEPLVFPNQVNCGLITTFELCKELNRVMKAAVSDWEGCLIRCDQSQIILEMYFSKNNNVNQKEEGKFEFLQLSSAINNNSNNFNNNFIQKYNNIVNKNRTNRMFYLSDIGKECLYDLVNVPINIPFDKINWDNYIVETVEPAYGFNKVYVKVKADLTKALKMLYGSSKKIDDNKFTYYDYVVNIIKPVGFATIYQNYLLSVQRYDSAQIEKCAKDIGIVAPTNSIPIIRD